MDPSKMIESGMDQTADILELHARVKEGKRLLTQALAQRDAARASLAAVRGTERRLLAEIVALRTLIDEVCSLRVARWFMPSFLLMRLDAERRP